MKKPNEALSRRDLLKSFGLAGLLMHPVLRSVAYAAPTPFEKAPRYVLFFKGGAFYPAKTNPSSLGDLAGTPIAPLQAHADDIILFKEMNIHAGSPKTNGYKEEHAAGIYGCTTGDAYKYYKNDSYFAYTDNDSIDIRIAEHYKQRADLKDVPIPSLHIGGGAHSDADRVGVGNRYISFRKRTPGDARHYGNAVEPMQNAGEVYDLLMRNAASMCAAQSNQPRGVTQQMAASLKGDTWHVDAMLPYVRHVQKGMDQDSAFKLDNILEDQSQLEKLHRKRKSAEAATATAQKSCASGDGRPSANGANLFSLDQLSPVHDQMIQLIKFAFQNDLTRVVAFTLSGASSGQTWPSRGVTTPHHKLEHNGDVASLVKIDTYYAEKFAGLLSALKSVDDGGGKSALYNSSVFLGMECWSNSSHGHHLTNVPFVFAGQGGGRFKTGRIVEAKGRNNNDLHVSCLNAAGVDTKTFGLPSLCQGPII
jgi:hypothetical protein